MTKGKSTNPVGKNSGKKMLGGDAGKQLVLVPASAVSSNAPRKSAKVKSSKSGPMLSAPAAVAGRMPKIGLRSTASTKSDAFRVSGCEIVGKAASQTSFKQVLELPINPRNPLLFPRLSAIAAAFEQYSIAKLQFHYVPQSSSARDGSMLHYIDYDPADPAAVRDVDILANKTKDSVALWQPSTLTADVRDIHRNRQSFFCQSPYGDSVDLSTAEVRQDFAGVYRMYMDGAADANKSCGYLFVEYIFDFLVPRPQPPVSMTAAYNDLGSLAIPTNTLAIVPFQTLESSAGLQGGSTVGAGSAYTAIGGVLSGVLDAARQVYESGKWLLTLRANASAPSAFNAPATPPPGWELVRDKKALQDDPPEWEASVVVHRGDQSVEKSMKTSARARGKYLPDVSTTISAQMIPYDATSSFNADFPAVNTGMTNISAQNVSAVWDGAGAIVPEVTCELTVPAGSRYCVAPRFQTDTTGAARTLTNIRLSAVRLTETD